MGRSQTLDVLQAQLRHISDQLAPPTETALSVLSAAISSRQSIAIAQAANLIREHTVTALAANLAKAFYRLLKNGEKTDPGCIAKRAIANALYHQEYGDTDLFLAGIHHRQRHCLQRKSCRHTAATAQNSPGGPGAPRVVRMLYCLAKAGSGAVLYTRCPIPKLQ